MRILVTGAAGFIGSAYVRHVLHEHPDDEVLGLDLLTYAGNLANLDEVRDDPRFRFVQGDIADAELVGRGCRGCRCHRQLRRRVARRSLAARSRRIRAGERDRRDDPAGSGPDATALRLLQVSTDEVYGHVPAGQAATEDSPLQPRSPYSAAKAGGELMCQAYATSYGTDVVITRGANTIGPRQYPEKLVPLFVTNALQDLPLPVYGDGRQIRNWLHAEDHAAAIDLVLRRGASGQAYNVGADNERENLEVVARHPRSARQTPVADSPRRGPAGSRSTLWHRHDAHHAMSWVGDRAGTGARRCMTPIDWYVANPGWWQAIRQRDPRFQEFYDRQYGHRLAGEGRVMGDRVRVSG